MRPNLFSEPHSRCYPSPHCFSRTSRRASAAPPSDAPAGTKDTSYLGCTASAGAPDVSAQLDGRSSRPSTASLRRRGCRATSCSCGAAKPRRGFTSSCPASFAASESTASKARSADVEGRALDVITSDVSMEEGVERYSNIRQNNKPRPSISRIGGAWSEGEYSTFLRQTAEILDSDTVIKMGVITRLNRHSGYSLSIRRVAVRQHLGLPGQIEALHAGIPRRSLDLANHRRSATHSTHRQPDSRRHWHLAGGLERRLRSERSRRALLHPAVDRPPTASPIPRDQHREWNVISFSDYHHYGVDITIHYN